MKFTHYDYKCFYFLSSDISKGIYKRRKITSPQRYQILLDHEYHTTYINVSGRSPVIKSFDLGVDFSPPKFKIKNRCSERLFLNFIIRGKGKINGESFSAGQFYYTIPYETHTIESDENEPYVSAWISLDGDYMQNIVDELNKKSPKKIIPIERRNDIFELTEVLLHKTNLGETSTSYLKSLIDIYLSYIKPNKQSDIPEIFASEKTAQLVRESKAYLAKNLKHANVSDMAAAQHYNKKYFCGIFTAAMGMKPSEYISNCKLEWARNSLVNSSLSITEIMEAIGYEHRNGFTIAFKKKYGYPPAEYRNKMKNDNSAKTDREDSSV